jgi:hypothetical protein
MKHTAASFEQLLNCNKHQGRVMQPCSTAWTISLFLKKNAQFLGILIKDFFPLECLCGFAICNASESEEFEKTKRRLAQLVSRKANAYSLPTRNAALKSLLQSLCTPQNRFYESRVFPFLIFCYDSDEVLHVQGLCFMFCELTADMAFKQMVLAP